MVSATNGATMPVIENDDRNKEHEERVRFTQCGWICRGELRMNADLDRVCILVRKFKLIGRVDLRLELDRFNGRTFQPQNLRAIAARRAIGADSLDLK